MRGITDYVLDHAVDKHLWIVYESRNGISERRVHVVRVDAQSIRTCTDGKWRTFLRTHILSALPADPWSGGEGKPLLPTHGEGISP